MVGNRSSLNYITDRFYNEFYSYIADHIEQNGANLNLNIYKVHNVGETSFTNLEVKMASIDDLPGMKINFDVVLEAEIKVSEGDYHYDDFDLCYQWFILNCTAALEYGLDEFKITGIDVHGQRSSMAKPLSDALVLYIRKDELESVATDFLNRDYPEALKKPTPIDPVEFVAKIGLTVEVRNITKDF